MLLVTYASIELWMMSSLLWNLHSAQFIESTGSEVVRFTNGHIIFYY